MCVQVGLFFIATSVLAQVSAQGSARASDHTFRLDGLKVSNTLWLRADGVFKHVIHQVDSGPHPHLTIAFGTWKRTGGVLLTKSEGSDWYKDRAGNWKRQLAFKKIWINPLAGDRQFRVVETEKTLVLKDRYAVDRAKGTYKLRKLDRIAPQSMPSEKDILRPLTSWVR